MSAFDMEYLGRTLRVAIEDALLNAQENKAKPTRDEIALRFAVEAYGANIAYPESVDPANWDDGTYDAIAKQAFKMADAYLAARDGGGT